MYLATDLPVTSYDTGAAWDEYRYGWKVKAIATEILADAPVSYYKCDETSGTTITDYGSAAINLTIGSASKVGTGHLIPADDSLYFCPYYSGSSANAGATAAGNPLGLTTWNQDLTLECIAWMAGTWNNYMALVSFQSLTVASAAQLQLYARTSGQLLSIAWYTSTGSFVETTAQSSTIVPNKPIHICVVKDTVAKTLTFYINGRQFSVLTYTTECSATATPNVIIGNSKASEAMPLMTSRIGHVALYSGKLADARIAAHARAACLYGT